MGEHTPKTIFLAGSARSGTTWVGQVIHYRRGFYFVYEPFWAAKIPECGHFRDRQYLRPDDCDGRYLLPAKAILGGQIVTPWVDRLVTAEKSPRILVKDIRANLFLKWIKTQFPETLVVFLLRHPCAVALSRSKVHWKSTAGLDFYLAQQDLMADFLSPFADILSRAGELTPFENFLLQWCVETYVPLKQFGLDALHVCFYEHLCSNPDEAFRALFGFLDEPFSLDVIRAVKKPSSVCRSESAIMTGGDLVTQWRGELSGEQVERAMEILARFGLDTIYGEDPMPDVDGLRRFVID